MPIVLEGTKEQSAIEEKAVAIPRAGKIASYLNGNNWCMSDFRLRTSASSLPGLHPYAHGSLLPTNGIRAECLPFDEMVTVTKAFAYLRVSGRGQEAGDGFTRQQLACETYARGNGIKIVRVLKRKAVPGTNELENRPALLELLEALASNGVRLVLIERLDRLARDLMNGQQ